MSAAVLLNSNGKILNQYLPQAPTPTNYVENPMTKDLDCAQFHIINVDNIECNKLIPAVIVDNVATIGSPGQVLMSESTGIEWKTVSSNVGFVPFEKQTQFTSSEPLLPQFTPAKTGLHMFTVTIGSELLNYGTEEMTDGVTFSILSNSGPLNDEELMFTYQEIINYNTILGGGSGYLTKSVMVYLLTTETYTVQLISPGTPSGGSIDCKVIQMC